MIQSRTNGVTHTFLSRGVTEETRYRTLIVKTVVSALSTFPEPGSPFVPGRYIKGVEENFSDAELTFDMFHIIKPSIKQLTESTGKNRNEYHRVDSISLHRPYNTLKHNKKKQKEKFNILPVVEQKETINS